MWCMHWTLSTHFNLSKYPNIIIICLIRLALWHYQFHFVSNFLIEIRRHKQHTMCWTCSKLHSFNVNCMREWVPFKIIIIICEFQRIKLIIISVRWVNILRLLWLVHSIWRSLLLDWHDECLRMISMLSSLSHIIRTSFGMNISTFTIQKWISLCITYTYLDSI